MKSFLSPFYVEKILRNFFLISGIFLEFFIFIIFDENHENAYILKTWGNPYPPPDFAKKSSSLHCKN